MSYTQAYKAQALPGMIGKVAAADSKAYGARNVGPTAVKAGYFVAYSGDAEVRDLAAATDVVGGVVVHSPVQSEYLPEEYPSVMTIGAGDAIWCVTEGTVKVTDPVFVRVIPETDKPAGAVLAVAVSGKTATTDYRVLRVTSGLALVGHL